MQCGIAVLINFVRALQLSLHNKKQANELILRNDNLIILFVFSLMNNLFRLQDA